MTMTEIVNENDNTTDSDVSGKVYSSYDDDVKFVEEYAKWITNLYLVNIDYHHVGPILL